MATSNGNWKSGLGLFQEHFASNPGLNAAQQGFDSWMRGMARCQLEMQGLVSRRAQAYLELPGRISHCRTPQELVQEQTRFWQTAAEQYSDCSRKMFNAWTQLFNLSLPEVTGTDVVPPRERDYLTRAEPRSPNGTVERQSGPSPGQRRVA